jgi:hypothetical protein
MDAKDGNREQRTPEEKKESLIAGACRESRMNLTITNQPQVLGEVAHHQ